MRPRAAGPIFAMVYPKLASPANALPRRLGGGGDQRSVLLRPFLADSLRLPDPGFAFARGGALRRREPARQRDLGVAIHTGAERGVAAYCLRIDVDLDRRRADFRHRPEMRGHAAG